ncbi:hypothetical protein D7Z26_11140 [Cohnella endophytica]|uniref:Uncharacterized protein n=1 Tax=Cohnella endophytica TaxID=2419778 RepID=A0A494XTI0_9BACL|nr:hypothetical protein D7Z26_11140 [Cohnella endophytica]
MDAVQPAKSTVGILISAKWYYQPANRTGDFGEKVKLERNKQIDMYEMQVGERKTETSIKIPAVNAGWIKVRGYEQKVIKKSKESFLRLNRQIPSKSGEYAAIPACY